MTTWTKPEIPDDLKGSIVDEAHDFWVEALTAGAIDGKTFMDGELLHGIQKVKTRTDAGGLTTVTITFLVRTLNKGDRP